MPLCLALQPHFKLTMLPNQLSVSAARDSILRFACVRGLVLSIAVCQVRALRWCIVMCCCCYCCCPGCSGLLITSHLHTQEASGQRGPHAQEGPRPRSDPEPSQVLLPAKSCCKHKIRMDMASEDQNLLIVTLWSVMHDSSCC